MAAFLNASWSELTRWDLKSAQAAKFRREHTSFKPLGDLIEDATCLVDVSAMPDRTWPVYGISNVKGVFLSHRKKGKTFNRKYKYKKIEEGWFIHNPTRANIGSIGRVPEVFGGAVTSPEYQVWRPKQGVDPDYIEVLVTSRMFRGLIDIHCVGGVKERLFLANLRQIPVPDLTEEDQRKLVIDIKLAKEELRKAKEELNVAERSAGDWLLGLTEADFRDRWRSMPTLEEEEEDSDEDEAGTKMEDDEVPSPAEFDS